MPYDTLIGMPALPGWYARLPDILATLSGAPPILDRTAFEQIFQVSRRQAIRLMASTGGYQVGKTFLVDRDGLIRFLTEVSHTPSARHAHQRKVRIIGLLKQHQRTQVWTAPAGTERVTIPGITRKEHGIVEIRYNGITELLTKIASLAAAAADDFPRFRETFE